MKKLLFSTLAAAALLACHSEDEGANNLTDVTFSGNASKRACPSEEIRQEALKNNPELAAKYLQNEQQADDFANQVALGKVLSDGTVQIPVIVNVLYKTSAQNLSDARIAEQIAVLNADFAGTNSDVSKIPSEFSSLKAGNTKIQFRLVTVNRKSTTKTSWSANDSMKKTSTGGINATSPANYLNIWVVGSMGGILGYATFPESAGLWNDGVVIATPYFGKTGATSPFNLGRTATHEVGHYLNLRHIWGDASCGNDLVADTPTQKQENYGKPTYPQYSTCSGVKRSIMFMNYMDYVDDAAMYMFSVGQKTRAQSVVASSGPRSGLRIY